MSCKAIKFINYELSSTALNTDNPTSGHFSRPPAQCGVTHLHQTSRWFTRVCEEQYEVWTAIWVERQTAGRRVFLGQLTSSGEFCRIQTEEREEWELDDDDSQLSCPDRSWSFVTLPLPLPWFVTFLFITSHSHSTLEYSTALYSLTDCHEAARRLRDFQVGPLHSHGSLSLEVEDS